MGCLGNKVVEEKKDNRLNDNNNINKIESENLKINDDKKEVDVINVENVGNIKREEDENNRKEEEKNEKKRKEEEDKRKKEEEQKKKREEEEERKKQLEEQRKKEEEQKKKREEEEEERKKQLEEQRKKREEEENKLSKREEERKKNKERILKEETERINRETEEKQKLMDEKYKIIQDRLKSEEEEEKDKKDEQEGRWTKYEKVGCEYRTKQQIRDYLLPLLKYKDCQDKFKIQPKITSPYNSGKLADESVDIALKMMNYARYAAGIPNEVVNDSAYETLAQDASLLMQVNNLMAHTGQPKPKNMNDKLYESGAKGCASCNLFDGPRNLYASVHGWLEDNGNFTTIGHRRWILHPPMKKTGFGKVGQYYAMHCFDNTFEETKYSKIPWPCRNMALEFGNSKHWTLSMGKEVSDDVVITITNKKTGQSKKLSKSDRNDFYISNQIFGLKGCIIFNCPFKCEDGDSFRVDAKGKNVAVSYDVNFFKVVCQHRNEIVETINSSCIVKGKKLKCCESCGFKSEESIPTIPHKNKLYNEISSTCSEKGKKIYVCEYCYDKTEEDIALLPHNFESKLLDEKIGKSQLICKVCNYKKEFRAPAYMYVYWRSSDSKSNDFINTCPYQNRINSKLTCYLLHIDGEENYNEAVIEVSDSDLIKVKNNVVKSGKKVDLDLVGLGECTITVYAKYNPSVKNTVNIVIKNEIDNNNENNDNEFNYNDNYSRGSDEVSVNNNNNNYNDNVKNYFSQQPQDFNNMFNYNNLIPNFPNFAGDYNINFNIQKNGNIKQVTKNEEEHFVNGKRVKYKYYEVNYEEN